MNITSTEDQETYTNYVNPIWVKLLDAAGMNVGYTHCSGSELYTADGRTILDCLSGHCVHNVGHNHPFVVAELVSELQSQSPAMLQSNVVMEAGALARTLCENAGGKVSKVFFCSSGSEGVETVIKFARAHTGRTDLNQENILTQICGNNFMVLKIAPPLTTSEQQMDHCIESIRSVIETVHSSKVFWTDALNLGRRAISL